MPISRSLLLFTLLLLALGTPGSALAQDASAAAEDDLAVLAQKSNNPLSDIWLLLFQNDYSSYGGELIDGTRKVNSLKFQPVMPVPVNDGKWNLIFRPIFQFNSLPLDDDLGGLFGFNGNQATADPRLLEAVADPWGRTVGLGDTVLLTLLGPNSTDGFIWGGGVTQIFPTAGEDILGQDKWQAGPAAIALRLGNESGHLGLESWNFGFLAQHWWSYAGDSDRKATSQTNIQYFLNWKMNSIQLVGMTPNILINWKADNFKDAVSLPIGLGTIGMFKIGKLPVRWGIELQYYLLQPDAVGPRFNLKVFFAPIIPNPFK